MEFWLLSYEERRGKYSEILSSCEDEAGNTLFKKRASHQVIYEPGPSKNQVGYCLVRRTK